MAKFITASLTSKGQLTLPREVRSVLGASEKGEQIGFVIDERAQQVRLCRVEIIPVDEDFTAEEYKKLRKLTKQRGRKTFKDVDSLLQDLHSSK